MPAFSLKGCATFGSMYVDGATESYWRTNGQTGSSGHMIGVVSTNTQACWNTANVITDSSQIIEVIISGTNTNTLSVATDGWYFPVGM